MEEKAIEIKEKVVAINRVAKVVKGGRTFRFSAVVVVGDEQGHVGVGNGKAAEVPDAIKKAIEEAKKNLTDLCKITKDIDCKYTVPQELIDVLCDDLNTPKAIALLNKYKSEKKLNELKNSLLFLNIYDEELVKVNKNLGGLNITEEEINNLIQERKMAKQNKNWAACDKIRDYLKEKHIVLKDNPTGCDWEVI